MFRLCKKIWPCHKKVKVNPRLSFFQTLLGPLPNDAYQAPRPIGSGDGSLKGFYHNWPKQASWSCDPDVVNKLLFSLPIKAPYEILPNDFWEEDIWSLFHIHVWVYEKQLIPKGGNFWPQGYIIWTNLVEVHTIKLHTKYQKALAFLFQTRTFLESCLLESI